MRKALKDPGRPDRSLASPRDARTVLARILDTPDLARAIPRLPPQMLHRVIQTCGLEDCGELVALTTPEQLSAVLDLDLWRNDHPGLEEQFDAARFGVWLEVLVESGAAFAAQRLSEIEPALVVAALASHISVFDPAALLTPLDGDDLVLPTADADLTCDVGGYTIVAKRSDSWDAIVTALVAFDEIHPESFHRVVRGCRRLSNSNSRPEIDGLDELMSDGDQIRFDLAFERERRRERLGYVTPEQARALLESSRHIALDDQTPPPRNPVVSAYFQALEVAMDCERPAEGDPPGEAADSMGAERAGSAVAAVVGVLLDAGILSEQPRALLQGAHTRSPRLGLIGEHLQFLRSRDDEVWASRSQELAFLANVLVAGCPIQARSFTVQEAFDGAVATCNLGLENWPRHWRAEQGRSGLPEDFLLHHELTSVFQVGWAILYRDVCLYAAQHLLGLLGGLGGYDRETQAGLGELRRAIAKHVQAGSPWGARNAFDVLAILDMPAWAALLGLIDECPVLLANVSAPAGTRVRSFSPDAFDFISENDQIVSVRAFMQSLPELLAC